MSACVEEAAFNRPMPQHVKPHLNPLHDEVCSWSSVVEVIWQLTPEATKQLEERKKPEFQSWHACCNCFIAVIISLYTRCSIQHSLHCKVRSCQCHCQCLTDFLFTQLNWRTQHPDNKSQRTDQREWNTPPATRKFVWTSPDEATTFKKEQRFSV